MIELKNVCKSYDGKNVVINNLSMTVEAGEFVVLVGESGCGKTTTMQMMNRLIKPTSGNIFINGKNIKTSNEIELRRNIGYVIQSIGLFPHRTIAQNIATVPMLCKKDKNETENRIRSLMEIVGLPPNEYAHRYPSELSGGQQQRAGVARALANEPEIILMDEPFSSLDPITREQLQNELLRICEELGNTIIFVTHDIDEAIKLGDKIAVLQDGKLAQFDTPEEILKNPANEYVAEFVGKNRLWKTPDMVNAEDVMNSNLVTINPNRSVAQAIEIMKTLDVTILCVANKLETGKIKLLGLVGANRLRGITDHSIRMKSIMKSNIREIPHDMPLTEVMVIREKRNVKFSPVIDDKGYLIGIITNASILNVLNQIMPGKEDY
ncbi:MAG: ABC transporter ATP-binding protein [Caldisericota bacterium]|nr:ABC transporter ATP-binding protein [Caldisericota bacterium]